MITWSAHAVNSTVSRILRDNGLSLTLGALSSYFLLDSVREYLTSGEFIEATADPESKQPGKPEAVDRDPRHSRDNPGAPWPVRRGGWVSRLYSNLPALAHTTKKRRRTGEATSGWTHTFGEQPPPNALSFCAVGSSPAIGKT